MFSAAAFLATCFINPAPLANIEASADAPVRVEAVAQARSSRPVSEAELAQSTGRAGFDLSTGSMIQLTDGQARLDFRGSGEIARTEMDVWWGTTGATLIATSVRSAGAF